MAFASCLCLKEMFLGCGLEAVEDIWGPEGLLLDKGSLFFLILGVPNWGAQSEYSFKLAEVVDFISCKGLLIKEVPLGC